MENVRQVDRHISHPESCEKAETEDRHTPYKESCDKGEHNIASENIRATIEIRIKLKNTLNSNEGKKQNITGIEPNIADYSESHWLTLGYCLIEKSNSQLNVIQTNKTKSNNIHSSLSQELLKSIKKDYFQQKDLHNSCQNYGPFVPRKDDSSNKTKNDTAYEDSKSSSNQIETENLNFIYESVENFLYVSVLSLTENLYLEKFEEGRTRQKKSKDSEFNSEKSNCMHTENTVLDECQFTKNRSLSKNSQETQTCDQIDSGKIVPVTPIKEINLHNQNKKNELKQCKRNHSNILTSQACIVKDEKKANKTFSEKSLENSIISKKLHEYVAVTVSENSDQIEGLTNLEQQSNWLLKKKLINAENPNIGTSYSEDQCKQIEEHSAGKYCKNVWTDISEFNSETNYILNQQNNQIFPENVYFLPHEDISILPLQPYITNSVFSQQYNGFLSSGTLYQYYDSGTLYDYGYQNFSNAMIHEQPQYYKESSTIEECPEYSSMANQNYANCLDLHNSYLNDSEQRPFVLSWADSGETYFQYYPDFAPVSYPCFISTAGRDCVDSMQQESLFSFDTDINSLYTDNSSEVIDESLLNI